MKIFKKKTEDRTKEAEEQEQIVGRRWSTKVNDVIYVIPYDDIICIEIKSESKGTDTQFYGSGFLPVNNFIMLQNIYIKRKNNPNLLLENTNAERALEYKEHCLIATVLDRKTEYKDILKERESEV